jgi:hypothetical protein
MCKILTSRYKKNPFILSAILMITFFTFSSSLLSQSQPSFGGGSSSKKSFIEGMAFTAGIGYNHYWGDLKELDFHAAIPFTKESQFAFSISAHKEFFGFFGVGIKAIGGRLKATDDTKIPSTNNIYAFETSMYEFAIDLNADLIYLANNVYKKRFEKKSPFSLLFTLGLGMGIYNSGATVTYPDGLEVDYSKKLKQEDVGKHFCLVYSYGLNFKYDIQEEWAIGIETSLRNLPTDNLDGWVEDGTPNDKYTFTALTVSYTILNLKKRNLHKGHKNRIKL